MARSTTQPPADERRERILHAARAVCAEAGYAGARMDAVARRAQVSKGSLYHFFDSKETLFEAALLVNHQEALRELRSALDPSLPPVARIEGLVERYAELLPEIAIDMPVNMQIWGVVAGDPEAHARTCAALADLYQRMDAALRETVEEGIASGAISPEADALGLVRAIVAIMDGFIYRSTFDAMTADDLRAALASLLREPLQPRGRRRGPEEHLV